MNGRRVRAWARWSVVAAAGAASALGAGVASADESYEDSEVGAQFALIRVGQIDDPLENVFQHLALLLAESR